MRLMLGVVLILLFLWLHKAQMATSMLRANSCQTSMSGAAASLLVSPLSLYSWMVSTLLRATLSIPALLLGCLSNSLLLLLALPWCVASISFSLVLTSLHVALYLLHLVLVVGVVVMLTLVRHKVADSGAAAEKAPNQRRILKEHQTKNRREAFGRRAAQQG